MTYHQKLILWVHLPFGEKAFCYKQLCALVRDDTMTGVRVIQQQDRINNELKDTVKVSELNESGANEFVTLVKYIKISIITTLKNKVDLATEVQY